MYRQRGDTIIEVMLAFVVFSLAVVSSITLMNKGLASAQRSLEITLVRQQIDAQLAMLDNFKQKDPAGWKSLVAGATNMQPAALSSITACPKAADSGMPSSFFMAANSTKSAVTAYGILPTNYGQAKTYAQVDVFANTTPPPSTQPISYGMWTTVVQSEGFATSHAYDVHVRACWFAAGDNANRPTVIATVARMYDAN